MVLFASTKFIYFARMEEKIGFIFRMLFVCFQKLIPFLLCLFLALLFFTLELIVLNNDIDEEVKDV